MGAAKKPAAKPAAKKPAAKLENFSKQEIENEKKIKDCLKAKDYTEFKNKKKTLFNLKKKKDQPNNSCDDIATSDATFLSEKNKKKLIGQVNVHRMKLKKIDDDKKKQLKKLLIHHLLLIEE